MSTFKDHFSKNASNYARYRPSYPPQMIEVLADLCPSHDFALDCGCGNGQLSTLLPLRFKNVIATDASAEQIENAKQHPRVTYHVCRAEDLSGINGPFSLVTIATAAHWFDLPRFYEAARPKVVPGAVIALLGYNLLRISAELDEIIRDYYYNVIHSYWPPERVSVEKEYKDLPFPFLPLAVPPVKMEETWDAERVFGYIRTWSATQALIKQVGDGPVLAFEEKMRKAWGNVEEKRTISWPLFIRAGRFSYALPK